MRTGASGSRACRRACSTTRSRRYRRASRRPPPSTTRRRCNRANNARSRSSSSIAEEASPRFVVAPDKFKGSLTAVAAAASIARGLHRVRPAADVRCVPMADGGEGTVDAFVESGWTRVVRCVTGPLGEPVDASFAFRAADAGGVATAVVEMAAASGLALLSPDRYDPMRSSTFGTGELIVAALERGARRIVVALGGSATNDGGAG
ncbi:MAG: glycerate kinase, partial [Candidatus Eremiobacteraeota bacterium]|nr:glycerate kinase [Candidatus Eremiobacteraeota bacterium]